MSAVCRVSLICDGLGCHVQADLDPTNRPQTMTSVRRTVAFGGWTSPTKHGMRIDLCPDCSDDDR